MTFPILEGPQRSPPLGQPVFFVRGQWKRKEGAGIKRRDLRGYRAWIHSSLCLKWQPSFHFSGLRSSESPDWLSHLPLLDTLPATVRMPTLFRRPLLPGLHPPHSSLRLHADVRWHHTECRTVVLGGALLSPLPLLCVCSFSTSGTTPAFQWVTETLCLCGVSTFPVVPTSLLV